MQTYQSRSFCQGGVLGWEAEGTRGETGLPQRGRRKAGSLEWSYWVRSCWDLRTDSSPLLDFCTLGFHIYRTGVRGDVLFYFYFILFFNFLRLQIRGFSGNINVRLERESTSQQSGISSYLCLQVFYLTWVHLALTNFPKGDSRASNSQDFD